MTILVLGINHKTASVALREKVAFSDENVLFALRHIRQIELAESAVILSTCNRTEVYLHNKTVPPQDTQTLDSPSHTMVCRNSSTGLSRASALPLHL